MGRKIATFREKIQTVFYLLINREKLKRYPLRMCFEYYTGPNKYESAVEYVEARFRAHFQQSRILARKTREIAEHPHLHKIRKPEESSNEDQEANKAK